VYQSSIPAISRDVKNEQLGDRGPLLFLAQGISTSWARKLLVFCGSVKRDRKGHGHGMELF